MDSYQIVEEEVSEVNVVDEQEKTFINAIVHFTRIDDLYVKCNHCPLENTKKGVIKRKHGNTSGMNRHLIGIHNFVQLKKNNSRTNEVFQPKRSDEIVGELAAVDGITFRQIAESNFIREQIFQVTKEEVSSAAGVSKKVSRYAKIKQQNVIEEIKSLKEKGFKFSMICDDATFGRIKLMSINIFGVEGFKCNLGLAKISSKCDAVELLKIANEKLEAFDLHPQKDVFAQTMDGASVCNKFGDLSERIHQKCYDHAIHLAVCKIFYEKKKRNYNLEFEEEQEENDCIDGEMDLEEDLEVEIDKYNRLFLVDNELEMIGDLRKIVQAVHKIAIFFKRSPKINFILQEKVKLINNGKELNLTYDICTRWNSMLHMLVIFHKILDPIRETLIHFNRFDLWDCDFEHYLPVIISILQPIKLTMDAISSDKSTLLTAEGAFETLFDELDRIDNNLSKKVKKEIQAELEKRRNKKLISLLKFLQNPSSLKEKSKSFFAMCDKKDIIEEGLRIWNKYFHRDALHNQDANYNPNENASLGNTSFEEKLSANIKKRTCDDTYEVPHKRIKLDPSNLTKEDFEFYIIKGHMSPNLKLLYDSLKCIKSTSVRCEQNFSQAKDFRREKRMKLSAEKLSDLCFLKTYLTNYKKQ
jgi:hypothetical protein